MNPKIFACGLLALSLGAGLPAWGQIAEDPDWKETEAPPPPAFDLGKVVVFAEPLGSSLSYGVDPATVGISTSDGLIRYVMVAASKTGARNIMYEAIRCATGEYKTYARYSSDGKWTLLKDQQWASLRGNMPSRHAMLFAVAGACDNGAPAQNVLSLVQKLKNPDYGMTKN